MISKLLNNIVENFGFTCIKDFTNSIVHTKLLSVTIPIAGISSMLQTLLGLQSFTIISFVVLVVLELVTGLNAAKIKGVKIESKKFSRFGLKVFVWMTLIFITNSMKLEYIDNKTSFGLLASTLFNWLHGALFIYVTLEYLISVLENLAVITGESNNTLITSIINKLTKFLNNDKK